MPWSISGTSWDVLRAIQFSQTPGTLPWPLPLYYLFFLFLFDFLIFLISLLFFFDITRYLAACFSFDCSFHCIQEHQALGEDWIRYRRKISGNKIRWK